MVDALLVTGATGFVGGAVTLELLRTTSSPVACLVRGRDAGQRLERSIRTAAQAYALPEKFVDEHLHRLWAVTGDLTGDVSQMVAATRATGLRITSLWHCAASLKFLNSDRDEIFQANVDGTTTMLELAGRLGVEAFHHVSTAYVAGHRSGRISELMPDGQRDTNNLYELSKIEAELLVGAAADRFAVNVFRPSIVVGHGDTRAATTFTGLYGFTRQLVRMSRTSRSQLSGWLSRKPVRILAEPETPLNLIPVDLVARQAVALVQAGCSGRVAHLSNATPTTVGSAIGIIFDRLDLHPPTYVDSRDEFNLIDSEFHREMNFYNSYLSGEKWFEQSTAREFGLEPLTYDFSTPVLRSFYDWYLDRLFAPLGGQVNRAEAAEPVGR